MALAHWAIDRQGLPAVGRAGRNAIAAYALSWLLTCVVEGFGWSASIYATGFWLAQRRPLLQSTPMRWHGWRCLPGWWG